MSISAHTFTTVAHVHRRQYRACVHANKHTHACMHVHTRALTHMLQHMHKRINHKIKNMCTKVLACVHGHMRIEIASIHLHLQVCTNAHTYEKMHTHMHVRTDIWINALRKCICACTFAHMIMHIHPPCAQACLLDTCMVG